MINKYEKLYAEEIDSKFNEYRDINRKEKENYINKKPILLPIDEQLSKLGFKNTQVDFDATRHIVKMGGKVIEIHEEVVYRENFTVSPFGKVIEKFLTLKQKYQVENNDLKQGLIKLVLNSLYGVQIRNTKNHY